MSPWDTGDLGGTGVLGGSGGGTGGWAQNALATDPNAREFGTILQLISEGPILGPVDGLKSIKLDGTPILDAAGNPNFKGVAVALVAGTNTQAMIPGFTDAESETSVNVKVSVSGGSVSRTISSTGISAIRVRVAVPSLKVINATTGAEGGSSVQVKIEKQSPSWNGGAWATETLEGNGTITGKFGAKYTKSYRIETPAAGPWTIKVTRLTADHTSGAPDYTQDETWWDAYTEITDAKLRYPYSAVCALKVDAKQFQQIPKMTGVYYGRVLDCVPSNYNPTTRAYTGIWDGTFQTAWTDNPAWIWYDMASHTRYGAGTVLAASKLDKWALYTIAQECDVLVSDGKGGTEPRFRCSVYFQNQEEAIKLLQDMASIFRGMVYWAGGLVTAVQDADGPVEAIFTNSNVKDGRFTYQGSARKSRHTAALVSWQDPDNGYQTSVEYVEDRAAIARYGYNPTQVAALGATSQAQAHRLGLWTLLTETMDTEVVTFASGLEGSTIRPGSIIATRDQFRAGDGRLGGRILAGATTTVIPLDGPCTLPAGTNTLSIRQADGTVETSTVTTAAGTVTSLTVSPAFSVAPPAMNQWALNVALYRVLSVKKGEGIYWEVTALQHTPSKYALVDGVTVTPGPATPDTALSVPSALILGDVVRIEKDKLVQSLTATWTGDTTALYAADASQDYGEWQPMKVNATSATLEPITPGSWRVRVRAVYPTGASPWVTGTATVATPTATATDAASAAAAAASALTKISDASADGIITDLERPGLKTLRATLAQAVTAAQTQANNMGVGHSTLDGVWATFTTNVDPILTATGNSAITKATWDGWWSAVYQEVQNLQGVLSTTANNAAAYANTLARSSFNLIKNGNSEDASPTGYEAVGVSTTNPYVGSKCRARAGGFQQYTPLIPCAPGDQFYVSAMAMVNSDEAGNLTIVFRNASGTDVGYGGTTFTNTSYQAISFSATAPVGATQFMIYADSTMTHSTAFLDCLYAGRKISAGMLEADLAIVGVIRSPNYVAGSYGNAPQGFKQSGYAFTTTFIDGTTDANCYQELGGSANFGGYKVKTVTDNIFGRVFEVKTAGSGTWICPVGVTQILIREVAAGGGGAAGTALSDKAGGAGGVGATVEAIYAVTPGTTYNFNVGAKGLGGTTDGQAGTDGGDTWFDSPTTGLVAKGGKGGTLGSVGEGGGLGGAAGVSTGYKGLTIAGKAAGVSSATVMIFQIAYAVGAGGGNANGTGGGCDLYPGSPAGTFLPGGPNQRNGGGGAASPFGPGGSYPTQHAPATSYGASGAGGYGDSSYSPGSFQAGGNGADGYLLIRY